MKKMFLALMGILLVTLVSGCATPAQHASGSGFMRSAAAGETTEPNTDRMLIWNANLNIQVWSISNAVNEATTLTERQGGYVEQKSDHGEDSASLTIRVPAKAFKTALSDLETLGAVTYRNIRGEDVTEQYIDIEARLNNKIVLRDRLKQLLEKATEIKDILAIETELNRVQGDIDSMEGRIKSLKG